MKRNFVVLFVAVNVLIVAVGGFLAYSDLYLREYEVRNHTNTTVVDVEYSPLVYRPTYEYYDIYPKQTVVSSGSWTLDFFQLTILIVSIADVLWLYLKNKRKRTKGFCVKTLIICACCYGFKS